MKKINLPRILMVIAILTLGLVFIFPLWRITLEAAQFPEGLHLNIWVNKFSGSSENIIQNINILNHYIGMQTIEPDSIQELKYFPYIVIAMMALGIVSIIVNNKYLYLSWFILMLILSCLGIYDFYLWLYDYGHNLDPNAPIKVPGMSYMPPLFGEKDLLNFYVLSYPKFGTIGMAASIVFSFLAFYVYPGKSSK